MKCTCTPEWVDVGLSKKMFNLIPDPECPEHRVEEEWP